MLERVPLLDEVDVSVLEAEPVCEGEELVERESVADDVSDWLAVVVWERDSLEVADIVRV